MVVVGNKVLARIIFDQAPMVAWVSGLGHSVKKSKLIWLNKRGEAWFL
jgi:hypothetical protein